MDTEVFVLMLKDRNGNPLGFHKVLGNRFYHTRDDAIASMESLGDMPMFGVFRAVIQLEELWNSKA